jgi:hypothetical protein
MSSIRKYLDLTTLTTLIAGILMVSTGALLIYNTVTTPASSLKPWLFTPVGLLLIIVGILLLLSKEESE